MDLNETECNDLDWIYVHQDWGKSFHEYGKKSSTFIKEEVSWLAECLPTSQKIL